MSHMFGDHVSHVMPYPCFMDRDQLIEQLMREIVDLKEKIAELEGQREADHTLMVGLRSRLQQLEAELGDYKEIAEQTCNVSAVWMRMWMWMMLIYTHKCTVRLQRSSHMQGALNVVVVDV